MKHKNPECPIVEIGSQLCPKCYPDHYCEFCGKKKDIKEFPYHTSHENNK
jgi:hypothetical protein